MLDGIPVDYLGIGSGWALVALFVILIYRGQLVPRKQYEDKEHEAAEWRTESRIKDQQIRVKDDQLRHLTEVGRTVEATLLAVQQALAAKGTEEKAP